MLIPYNTDAPIYHRPLATIGLIVLNVVVFIPTSKMWESPETPADWHQPGILDEVEGSEFPVDFETPEVSPDIADGGDPAEIEQQPAIDRWILIYGEGLNPVQWVTSNFIHGDIFHLLGNMFIIWGFGLVVEGKIGWWRFLVIFLGIGIVECAIEQSLSCVVQPEVIGSYGASAIAYGLIAIALVWAPKNDMNCILFIIIRPIMFDMSVMMLAILSICFEFALAYFLGWGFSSQVLHLMGAGVGLIIGVGMLKLGWVDCEDWDIFSVLTQKTAFATYDRFHDEGKGKREVIDERDLAAEQARALDQIRKLIEEGQPALAYAAYQRTRRDDPSWTLPDPDFLRMIEAFHKKKVYSDSVPVMAHYLGHGQQAAHVVRLRLADILIRIENRPAQALVVLSKLSAAALNDKQKQTFARLKAQAERMKAAGSFETAPEDW